MKKVIKTLCVDFDGVIHSYKSGWQGAEVIPDPMVDGAAEWLLDMNEEYNIVILSTRCEQGDSVAYMAMWMELEMLRWVNKERGGLLKEKARVVNFLKKVTFSKEKVPAMVYIDDRGFRFEGEFPSIDELKVLEIPWNKRK